MTKPLLQIIVGSVRTGRSGAAIASWFEDYARTHERGEAMITTATDGQERRSDASVTVHPL